MNTIHLNIRVTMVGHLMHGTRLPRNFKREKDIQVSQKFKSNKRKKKSQREITRCCKMQVNNAEFLGMRGV
jgi:hypothetical protein